jgi:hypothetical protein
MQHYGNSVIDIMICRELIGIAHLLVPIFCWEQIEGISGGNWEHVKKPVVTHFRALPVLDGSGQDPPLLSKKPPLSLKVLILTMKLWKLALFAKFD